MTLTKLELKVLATIIEEETTLKDLAQILNLSKSTLSTILHPLKEKGLVELERRRKLIVRPSKAKATSLLHTIILKYPQLNILEILAGNSLKVLSALEVEKPQPAWLIELKANVSRATLYRSLNKLMDRLIVGEKGGGYFITEKFADLKFFADEYFYLQNSIRVKRFNESASLVWSGVGEFILVTKRFKGKAIGRFQLTGPLRLSDYGVSLISPGIYHYYWPAENLALEDVIVHTVKVYHDGRGLLYVIEVLKTNNFDERRIKKLAAKFGVSEIVNGILDHLKGKSLEGSLMHHWGFWR
ncbi:hypothetical protein A3L04_05350 [Thermococcus chitonophagus]|uniref:HTH crp-type domain-containing protein n=1 Tax=Thermococcus chitonophagus TaxID=54262 RepID=A0A170SHM1_9EURY|nr:helix-turn-helix domain-containing protein [Thermococcus chitonophagus]ASJ16539.1 hypothetical protein A3L04_05350 [Thermococcus chitonophagus]CUX77554.1 hypothetical protein CHITON_0775 [Thermococcus chitonophagus]